MDQHSIMTMSIEQQFVYSGTDT